MIKMKDVTFLLPAYNEEPSIGSLIKKIKELYPNSNIIVINNLFFSTIIIWGTEKLTSLIL